MSISVEKLSLLGALAPLRQKFDNDGVQQENGFAGKLDKALSSRDTSFSNSAGNVRELAESLTMQMLQSSLTLATDSPSDGATLPGSSPFSSANAILQAYRDNVSSVEDNSILNSKSTQSQLKDLAGSAPVSVRQEIQPTDSYGLDSLILRASLKYGVEVGLIKAVIKAESDFNPQAVSHAGARGLMQLMPDTARSLGVNDSFDPEQNIMGGTRFLKEMLHRYKGNIDAALAAYNWGPGNVDKRPDHLPRETRDYLTRVKQLYASYSV